MGETKRSGPHSPGPTCGCRMGPGGAAVRLAGPGWGEVRGGGTRRPRRPLRPVNDIPAAGAQTRPRGSSAAHAPPAGRGRLARLPAPYLRERRGLPGSPVRAPAPPRLRGCPAPPSGVGRPRAPLPPRVRSLPSLTGSWGRPRAFRRRAGASAGEAPRPCARGGGRAAPEEQRGRSSRLLGARSPGGKGRALPDGAEAAMQGGGRMGKERARHGWGLMVQWRLLPPPWLVEKLQPHRPPRS
ncbi:unnamed protein product [Rangifer tarandus platyrhynchus]|uniref:Uncharacterized protein n=2 Tax=Rangifer tarandus platyrhynchus TaxID=3082113 RepID=A0ABN8ZLU0_RANTA|nr:unnamed protein product [Rangifer tarandus platyrhynchus]CAI9706919.1 unnamed protein product [Rangifer tarandus platyrhynchus]